MVDWIFDSVNCIDLKLLHNKEVIIKSNLFNIIMYITAVITVAFTVMMRNLLTYFGISQGRRF